MNDPAHDSRHDGVDAADLPDADRLDRIADRLTHGLLDQAEPASAGAAGAAPMAERAPGPLASRRQAYRLLSEVADYLQRLEPHSPTPYLIRRAVRWGELPLPALMQEMMREEGDLQPLLKLLAVQPAEH